MFLSTCITVLLSITYICYYLDGGEPFGGKPPFVTGPPEDMRSKSQGNLMREDERAKWQPGGPPGPTSPPDNRYGLLGLSAHRNSSSHLITESDLHSVEN